MSSQRFKNFITAHLSNTDLLPKLLCVYREATILISIARDDTCFQIRKVLSGSLFVTIRSMMRDAVSTPPACDLFYRMPARINVY